MKLKLTAIVTMVALITGAIFYADTSARGEMAAVSTIDRPCASFQARHLEVCTAYVFNASLGARWPFYHYATSGNAAQVVAATNRLASRYYGAAFDQIVSQTVGWPSQVDVSPPTIRILSMDVSPDQNFATLTTVESWDVHTENGTPLFQESNQPHTIQMQRVPGLILHKWVVVYFS
jgi:hypothetical protein